MNSKETAIKILTACCRLLIGVVFVFSGFVKAVDPMGGAIKIEDYLTSFGLDMLQPFAVSGSFLLSTAEFVMGVCLLLGVYRRKNTFLILLFMAFMTPLTLYLALFNPVSDCGCFGDAIVISNWETFYKNVVLMAAAIVVFKYRKQMLRLYSYKVYWFIAFFSCSFLLGFAYWNYNHLPVIDFRPYKIGANIPELMAIPEGAPEDEYAYTFIYEKAGVQQEFTLENYPADDSTWTFVETKADLIKKGYEPAVDAFNIFTEEGEDIADIVLHHPGPLFLLIAHKIEDADAEKIDEMNSIYDYALEQDYPFFFVTGSSPEMFEEWRDNTGAEYPFYMADEVLLKTIIRSNPGLVMLKEGTVLGKWHYNDFPEEEQIPVVVDDLLNPTEGKEEDNGWQTTILLTFTVPLLLVWIYDYFRNRKRFGKKKTE